MEDSNHNKAVSPVVGVILMVAITVILAAVIGTFVLDLGSNVEESATAGLSVEVTDGSNGDIRATVVSLSNAEQVNASATSGSVTGSPATSVGDTITVTGMSDGAQVTFTATSPSGESTVVQTYTFEG